MRAPRHWNDDDDEMLKWERKCIVALTRQQGVAVCHAQMGACQQTGWQARSGAAFAWWVRVEDWVMR